MLVALEGAAVAAVLRAQNSCDLSAGQAAELVTDLATSLGKREDYSFGESMALTREYSSQLVRLFCRCPRPEGISG